jgi:hypothetical protein
VAVDTNRTRVSVYSEKERAEIFRYSLVVDGPFDFLDELGESRIEIQDDRTDEPFKIVVHIRAHDDEPKQLLKYRWKNGRFKKTR